MSAETVHHEAPGERRESDHPMTVRAEPREGAGAGASDSAVEERIEGVGDSEDASWDDYPLDALFIRNEHRTVHDILRRIGKGSFVMDPEFQRGFLWPEGKQSRLIESVVMRIPLPVFYLAEDERGRMVVLDGIQRLYTFKRFVNDELPLRLSNRPELDGKRFRDLSPKLQNRVEDCSLILYILDSDVPDRARLDIFERVNSGVPLSRQQMRNALYMGSATRFLKDESCTDVFLATTGGSLRTEKMRDREFVNRFAAFQLLGVGQYRDMDDFLADALTNMNRQPELLAGLSSEFRTALENNYAVFGRHAFRKHRRDQDARSVINASLWDVMTTGLSRYSPVLVRDRAGALLDRFFPLVEDPVFIDAITYSPNSVRKVQRRFEMAGGLFEEVLGAHAA